MPVTAASSPRVDPATAPFSGFVPEAGSVSGLDATELARFERDGWVGSYPLLTPWGVDEVVALRDTVVRSITKPEEMARATAPDAFVRKPWFKSMHTCVSEYFDIAKHPAIVNRVRSILGPDVIAWGVTITLSVPGGVHRWHVDNEHRHWHGVSVYLGLTGSDLDSALKVITGSQHMPQNPQAHGIKDDTAALAAVRREVPAAEMVSVPIAPGEFFLFAGRTWHGSHNTGANLRLSMILQYSRPDARVRIPLNFDEPIHWHPSRPPCVLVAGQDRHGCNRLVERPAAIP